MRRAWRPLSPKTSTIRSDAPFITFGPSVKPGAELMKPPRRTTRTTLSRSPSAALSCASRLIAQARAAFLSVLNRNAAAELAFGDQFAVGAEANLARNHEHIAAAHERHIVGDRACWRRQSNAETLRVSFQSIRPCCPPRRENWRDPWPIGTVRASSGLLRLPESASGLYLAQILHLSAPACRQSRRDGEAKSMTLYVDARRWVPSVLAIGIAGVAFHRPGCGCTARRSGVACAASGDLRPQAIQIARQPRNRGCSRTHPV